ncbi:MAG TPA: hypothetical protein DER60_04845 [Syntrophomonas sp.]|jgi:hypothetical protein|nr:hypothetical protein [Syntrophomonas sp.]
MRKLRQAGIAALLSCAFLLWTLSSGAGVALAAAKPDVSAYFAEVEDDYVILEGVVDDDGGDDITEYGFYYGEDEDDMDKVKVGSSISEGRDFSKRLYVDDELDEGTTYYFRAYARSSAGTGYSSVRSFKTEGGSGSYPTVITEDYDLDGVNVTIYGSIDDDGGYDITEYGFYYGEDKNDMEKIRVGRTDIDEGDEFEYELEDLDEDTRYYYQAYAKNSKGTDYGDIEYFYTDEDEGGGRDSDKPDVTTKTPLVGVDYFLFYGIVDDRGDSDIKEYGFYWGTDNNPSNKVNVGTKIDEDRTFSYEFDDPKAGQTYYVKAYARNSSGTSYGDTVRVGSSKTGNQASLDVKVTNVVSGSATLMGTVLSNGDSTITEYGFYYAPTGGTEKQIRFFGSISANMPYQYYLGGLTPGTYTVKSYAVNSAGTAYSLPATITVSGSGSGVVTPPPTTTPAPAGKAPVVLVSTPAPGMVITRGQTIEIASSSTDDVKVEAMGMYINGIQKFRCTGSSFQYFWSTAGIAPGTYTIRITSWDGVLVGERVFSVTVN